MCARGFSDQDIDDRPRRDRGHRDQNEGQTAVQDYQQGSGFDCSGTGCDALDQNPVTGAPTDVGDPTSSGDPDSGEPGDPGGFGFEYFTPMRTSIVLVVVIAATVGAGVLFCHQRHTATVRPEAYDVAPDLRRRTANPPIVATAPNVAVPVLSASRDGAPQPSVKAQSSGRAGSRGRRNIEGKTSSAIQGRHSELSQAPRRTRTIGWT